jgi:hypothetical protein
VVGGHEKVKEEQNKGTVVGGKCMSYEGAIFIKQRKHQKKKKKKRESEASIMGEKKMRQPFSAPKLLKFLPNLFFFLILEITLEKSHRKTSSYEP